MEKKAFLECGKITSTHGVKGGCKVECWCDSPKILCQIKTVYLKKGEDMMPLPVRASSVFRDMALLSFEGYPDLDSVMCLRGQVLYAKREDIPLREGQILLADMIGLPVIDKQDGRVYGHLSDIDFAPASAIYHVTTPKGEEVLIPAIPQFIKEVDETRGIFVELIPGFFDDI